jgi:tRNA nucleotidyltransferase (CCA-adding enzyme)
VGEPPISDLEALDRFRRLLRQEQASPHRLADIAVDGRDLLAIGFRPGPDLGRALQALLHDVVDDPSLNTKDALLQRAGELLKGSAR